MARFYDPLRDVQQDAPVSYCPRCSYDEIYRYDEVASIRGELVHRECMTAEELEDYPTAPAISFCEEAC